MSGFAQGEADAAGAMGGTEETMGASLHVSVVRPARGEPSQPEPYLIQSVHNRIPGSLEQALPAITHTPLGAMMPSVAMPPPIVAGYQGAHPVSDNGGFGSGITDGYPDGIPVPVRG